ncbi:hypothetical protein [Methanosphaerula subterraneus]|uniref:hypothetical protein n=1 Tax=Methanosphaerula subterraneus TaxID=3350244 RepID=UPI003F8731CB
MTGVDPLQLLSVLLEVIIVAGAVFIAVKKQKRSSWAIAATFALYVFFDLSRMGILPFTAQVDGFLFLIANVTMLVAIWLMMQEH